MKEVPFLLRMKIFSLFHFLHFLHSLACSVLSRLMLLLLLGILPASLQPLLRHIYAPRTLCLCVSGWIDGEPDISGEEEEIETTV